MKLPDFLSFEAFNQLRQTMGAEELGDFVFFDPKRHLTGLQRLSLEREGLALSPAELRPLGDFTLAYKDTRVLLYQPPVSAEQGRLFYHLADCPSVYELQGNETEPHWWVRANNPNLIYSNVDYRVCSQCLQRLRYQDFDAARNRHREYSKRVQEDFDLEAFFLRYPSYPINEQQTAPVF